MPFKVFTNGSILPDTDLNDYLMEQVIISCTSGTRPGSPNDGMMVFETDTEAYRSYDASLAAWQGYGHSRRQSFTPALQAVTTNPTIGTTGNITSGWYTFSPGNICNYNFFIQFGSSGAAAGSGQYLVTLPFTSALPYSTNGQPAIGSAMFRDSSASAINTGVCYIPASNAAVLAFYIQGVGTVTNAVPWTWAGSDYLAGSITYPM